MTVDHERFLSPDILLSTIHLISLITPNNDKKEKKISSLTNSAFLESNYPACKQTLDFLVLALETSPSIDLFPSEAHVFTDSLVLLSYLFI